MNKNLAGNSFLFITLDKLLIYLAVMADELNTKLLVDL